MGIPPNTGRLLEISSTSGILKIISTSSGVGKESVIFSSAPYIPTGEEVDISV